MLFAGLHARNRGRTAASRSEQAPHLLRIAYGRGESDPPRSAAREPHESLNQAKGLPPAVLPKQRMNLIDHNKA